jgi:2-polyprenyl-3-methyl-5-hydroxy-6-metoxy-1,4-benzoquinol methylase
MEDFEYVSLFRAEDHHWWYVGLHDLIIRLVKGESEQWGRPMEILDAGCGTGRLCQLMQPYGCVQGCDLHPLALEGARSRGLTCRPCDLTVDELGTGEYHLVTAIDVLSHRRIPDEALVLEKFHRAIRRGGCLMIQVPAFTALRGAHDLAVHTRRRYHRSELVGLLEAAGFTVELATYRLSPFFLPAWLWRTFTRRRVKAIDEPLAESDLDKSDAESVTRLLAAVVKLENRFLGAGVRAPFGTSLFAVARR